MSEIQEGAITREIQDHVFLMGIHRASKMNAFTWDMLSDLSRAFSEYEENENLRCAVLYAAELAKIMKSEDAVEGVASFIERRPANFKGR
jgi:enoyl-CoA hydratase/carnithine racemase